MGRPPLTTHCPIDMAPFLVIHNSFKIQDTTARNMALDYLVIPQFIWTGPSCREMYFRIRVGGGPLYKEGPGYNSD